MQYCVARASFCRPGLPGEPINPHEDEAEFLQWLGLATEFAKAVAPYQTPKLLPRMRSKRRLQKAEGSPARARASDSKSWC